MTTKKKPRSMTIRFGGTPEQNMANFSRLCEALTVKPFDPRPNGPACSENGILGYTNEQIEDMRHKA